MGFFQIQGGYPLSGTVQVQGAKNSVLPILAATLLSPGECVLHNCPRLTDVDHTLDILRHLGCRAEREGDTVRVDPSAPTAFDVPDRLMGEMRSSVLFLGPLLARQGMAQLSQPGGCEAGWGHGFF
jgi:UDP-N-acetylglucosamine 1-carboxyvinyltransferase